MASFTIKYMLYRHAPGPRLILLRVISTKCSLRTVIVHRLYLTQPSVVSAGLVGAVVGVVAEDNGGTVGADVGVGLADGFGSVKVSLSPNVPSSPFRDTKQKAGGSVPNVGNDVGFNDTLTDGGFVVVKTVKKISSVFCPYFYETFLFIKKYLLLNYT